jgi:hypothetical protein
LGVWASDAFPAQVGLPVLLQVAVIAVGGHRFRSSSIGESCAMRGFFRSK